MVNIFVNYMLRFAKAKKLETKKAGVCAKLLLKEKTGQEITLLKANKKIKKF